MEGSLCGGNATNRTPRQRQQWKRSRCAPITHLRHVNPGHESTRSVEMMSAVSASVTLSGVVLLSA